jgi:thiopeptide-type bacteriocin biosynthesis protein
MRRLSETTLQEVYPSPEHLCVTSPEGRFWHELFLPMNCVASPQPTKLVDRSQAISNSDLAPIRFIPGTEWLYLKIYGGTTSLDEMLSNDLPKLLVQLAPGSFRRWFFVRYADPNEHLRIRFCGEPDRLEAELLPIILRFLSDLNVDGKIWKFELDTYQPEMGRYGGPQGVLESEQIFYADSLAVLGILSRLPAGNHREMRWRVALMGIDALLNDFGLDVGAKRDLLTDLSSSIQTQSRLEDRDQLNLALRFRTERRALSSLFDENPAEEFAQIAKELFGQRSFAIRENIDRLQDLARTNRLHERLDSLLGSYIHMHINRLMRSDPNQYEVVLYEFLRRLYNEQSARSNKKLRELPLSRSAKESTE